MGTMIKVKGASFEENALAFIPPVADGLEYWNFFGGNAAKTSRNLAAGKPSAVVVGNPTFNANSAVFVPGSNYLQTSVADTPDITMFVIAKPLTDKSTYLISNIGGADSRIGGVGSTNGRSLCFIENVPGDGLVAATMFTSRWDGISSPTNGQGATTGNVIVPGDSWKALVGRVSETEPQVLLDNKTASMKVARPLTLQSDLSSSPMRIGGGGSVGAGFASSTEMAAAIIYSRALSDDEVAKVYNFLRGYYARRGIAI